MMRSEKLRRLVAMLPCMCCGQKGQTQAAHANFQSFGKGMGIKASDAALMALCVRCHAELDQGQTMTKEERRNAQYEGIAKAWAALAEQGKVAVGRQSAIRPAIPLANAS